MNKKTDSIIKTTNLEIGYPGKKENTSIAGHLNIELNEGNLVCLLGKNGIGKSTLLRTLTKVQPPLKGSIDILGKSLENLTATDLSKCLSLVLSERLPESNLTVFELVALGRQPYTNWVGSLTETDLHFINLALDQTNTQHLAGFKYFELSDGQLQKVLIARALAQNTSIIILDEPTAHLDVHHTIETFVLLKKLVREFNKTILISTHEINLALEISDILWLMTPENFTSGITQDLIANDQLNALFNSKLVRFDKDLKQFTLIKSE